MSKLDKIFTYPRYIATMRVPYRTLSIALQRYDNSRTRVVAVRFFKDYVEIDVMPR